jgi:His/Glu/Gln/Arg/opine family amino acid ABC transporter permease subunit
MHFDFHVLVEYYPVLLQGTLVTLEYTVLGLVTSLCFGTLVAVLRTFRIPILDGILVAYINVCREVPLLVQIYFIYFGLPEIGIALSAPEVAIISITLNEGAFVAEIVRGGIQSLPRGQWEASKSVAMSRLQTMYYVILPQAMRRVVPSLVGHTSYIVKDTSVLTVIAIEEVTSASGYINDMTLNSLTAFSSAAAIYVAIFWLCQYAGSKVERALSAEGNSRWN